MFSGIHCHVLTIDELNIIESTAYYNVQIRNQNACSCCSVDLGTDLLAFTVDLTAAIPFQWS